MATRIFSNMAVVAPVHLTTNTPHGASRVRFFSAPAMEVRRMLPKPAKNAIHRVGFGSQTSSGTTLPATTPTRISTEGQPHPGGGDAPVDLHSTPYSRAIRYAVRAQCRSAAKAARSTAAGPNRPVLSAIWYSSGLDQSAPKKVS